MTIPKTRLIGATTIAALALAGALVAWQASFDSPAAMAQLSDDDKLEILNSGDADAISELLEAEEAAAQAHFARERLERQKREDEIDVERTEAKARGAAYWDSFDPESIDLTGFDFAITSISPPEKRREKLAELPIVSGFDRAAEMTHPPSSFDCDPTKFAEIGNVMKSQSDLPMPVDRNDLANLLDYLASRAALQTGDCSCATQAVPPIRGWELARRIAENPTAESIRGSAAKGQAMKKVGATLYYELDAQRRSFCGKG